MDLPQSGTFDMENIPIFNQDFTFDLFRQCAADAKGTNFALAPNRVTAGLAKLYMGARGNTAQEIKQALKWPADISPEGFGSYLSSLKKAATEKTPVDMTMGAQSIYVDRSLTLTPSFATDIQEVFGSQVMTADFRNHPEDERKSINSWMLEQTQGKVRDLLSKGAIDSSTSVLLTQGTFDVGKWVYSFDPKNTEEGNFYSPLGTVRAHMMEQIRRFNYYDSEELKCAVVWLPYTNDKGHRNMIIALPKDDQTTEKLERELSSCTVLGHMKEKANPVFMHLKLPRFSVDTTLSLRGALVNLGMPQLFGNDADLSGMVKEGGTSVSLFHEVALRVDEEGIYGETEEAARSTGQEMMGLEARSGAQVKSFIVDRPFIFFLAGDELGGGLSQWGRVVDPN